MATGLGSSRDALLAYANAVLRVLDERRLQLHLVVERRQQDGAKETVFRNDVHVFPGSRFRESVKLEHRSKGTVEALQEFGCETANEKGKVAFRSSRPGKSPVHEMRDGEVNAVAALFDIFVIGGDSLFLSAPAGGSGIETRMRRHSTKGWTVASEEGEHFIVEAFASGAHVFRYFRNRRSKLVEKCEEISAAVGEIVRKTWGEGGAAARDPLLANVYTSVRETVGGKIKLTAKVLEFELKEVTS